MTCRTKKSGNEETWKVKFFVESLVKSKPELWEVADRCAEALRAVKSGIPAAPYDANEEEPDCYNGMLRLRSSNTFVWLVEAGINDYLLPPNRQTATTGNGFHERTVWIRVARGQDGSYGAAV
jgi:hypothetical protein